MATLEELKRMALEAQKMAYCPYSHFPVGAALECMDGTVYTGCNIENSSYPVGSCAERTAVSKAISDGRRDFKRIVIVSNTEDVGSPCGMCRQFLFEFSPDMEIVCLNGKMESRTFVLRDLLAHGFNTESLLGK